MVACIVYIILPHPQPDHQNNSQVASLNLSQQVVKLHVCIALYIRNTLNRAPVVYVSVRQLG